MFIKLPSIYHKIKASVLLLCLGFMILGTCPIQKILLNASSVKTQTSDRKSVSKIVLSNQLSCSYGEEIVKAPLIELTKKSKNNALYFVLLGTLVYLFTSFVANGTIPFVKKKNTLGSSVPLFLRNQVFII